MQRTFTVEELNQLYSRKGYGRRVGFGTSPAVIVIDFTKGFTDQGATLGCDLANAHRGQEETGAGLFHLRGLPE